MPRLDLDDEENREALDSEGCYLYIDRQIEGAPIRCGVHVTRDCPSLVEGGA